MDKTLLYDISYGLYVIGAVDQGRLVGCISNTVAQITSTPQTLAISLNKDNYTYQVIERTKKFTINILSEETDPSVITSFGFRSSKEADKYEDFHYTLIYDLPVLLENCCGTFLCEVISSIDMGTHVVLFTNIIESVRSEKMIPMTYSYYHNVIKGTSPKNAPTYQKEETDTQTINSTITSETDATYQCSICGYIYDGDITKEPDDFNCPVCGAIKEKLKKIIVK